MSFEVDLDSAVLESDYYKDDTANKPERKSTGFSPEAGPAKQPAPFSVDLESAELDEKASQGFLGTLIDGTKSAARSVGATVDTYAGDAQGVVDKAKTQNEQRNDINLDRFNADIAKNTGMGGDEEAGLWDSVKGVGKAIIDNPKGAGLAVVEQFPNAVPALAGGYAGMKTGAAVGAAAGAPFAGVGAGPGAFIGGIVGGLSGMFLGNTLIETGGKALEYAQDGEFTPEEMSKTKKEGAVKAGVITGIDALTLGVGGKISSNMQRTVGKSVDAATRKALLDAGVDISDAAALAAARSNPVIAKKVAEAQQNAAKISDTLRRRGVELGTLLTVESVGEGLGEYLGELAATGEASIPEAVLESFLSLGQSSVETMFNFSRAREKSLTEQEWVDAANGIAPEGMPQEDMPVADGIWGEPTPEAKIDMGQMQEGGVTPSPVFEPQDIDRNLGPTPSQQMGINPDDGPLSAAAAQSVDSGLFTGGFTPQASINQAALEREGVTPPPVLDTDQIDRNLGSIDPITGEYIPAPERIGQQAPEKTTGNYEYDQWGNLNKVDGRAVDGYDAGQPRLGFNSKAERSTAPMYEVSPDGVARPTSGESARSMKERVDLSGLDRGKQQTQPQQAQQQQAKPARTPEQDAQSIWNSLNSFERNAAVADTLGMRGVPAKAVAARNWEALSKKQKEKLVGNLTAKQGSRWTDPNQKATDQSGPVLQNRDRTSHDSIMQMRGISNNPDYNRLKTSGFLSDGAPVVINEKIQIPESQLGVTDTASAGDQKFNVQYAAVEADQLATSNNIDGTVNPDYATGPDGKARAIAGNGRVTGLQSAWAKGKAGQYKTDMAADKMHGIDPAVIKGMKNPVLVRLLPQDQVTDNIGDLSNRDEKGKLSPVEQAKTDMGRIDLDSLKFTTEGAIGGEAIHQFRMAQPAAERVSEAEARKRLTSAIFQKAYGNDQLTEIQAGESEDAKSIMSALAQAAPSMSRLEGAGEYDVRPLIAQAGIAAVNAARRGAKLADYVQQSEMGIDPIVYPILEMMLNENGNIRSSKYIGEQLTNMAKLAYDEANSPSSDMFGEKPKRTGEQVIQDALTGVQGYGQINDGRGQESLGQRGRPESDAQMAEGPEGGRERPADTGQAARAQPEAEQGQPATVENEVPEKWRSNYLQAAKVARDLGIDPKQHKKLADLVAAIDAFNAEPVASQPQQQVAAAKPAANNKTSVHIDNAIDLTSALAAIARGAQLSTEPNGDVILSGAKIITLPKQPTSANEVIGALAVALRDQMRADGVSMPGNPADMTRDQFVVAYEFANIIPEFEITGEDIGGVVQGSSSGLTVDADKLYDKIIEQAKEQANPALELNQQTEETLAQDAERLEQLQKEEAAQKAKQKAAESKARERDADKARADEVVDDFQLGQPAEDAMSGMDDIFATESKSAKENTSKNTAPQTGLSIKSHDADIDTFNNWSKNVYESVAGWRLFDRSSERFGADISLFRKIKKANAAGGGYVSAQLIKGFSSVEEARAWAKENKVTISMPTVEIKTNKAEDKTKASADKQTTPKAPTEAIKDYGEKMAGAIKDQPKTSLSENLTDEDIASQALSKIWPAKEVMESDDDFIAAFAYAARSRIPAKPRVKYKIDRWVRTVQGSRRFAQAAATGRITIESLNRAATRAESGLEEYANQVKLLMQIDRKDWGRIGDIHDYSKAYRFDDEGNKQPSPHISVNIDGVITKIDGATTIEETFSKVKNVISKDSKAASKNDPRQFEIRTVRSTGEIFINRKGDKEYRELKSFKKGELAAARDFVRNNTDDLAAAWEAVKERDNVSKADVRGDTNAERAGKDYRNGKDVTSEEFGETFGFRGVEFGNWVSQGKGQADRQGMLNAAYDALLDLASIVGVPPKAISLNGSLGIAFGSRGKGKASAHYETDNIVINLTKTKGAGSLAHEWFHALDNYFSRSRGVTPFDGNNAAYNKANYITYKPEPMMALKTSLNKKGIRPYLITKAEYDRRVERGVNFDAADWTPDTNHPAGVRPKVEKAFAGLVNELDKSPMLARAEKIDKGKVDGYWSSIIERAARSFESYVIAKLEQQGQSNDYLANVVPITSFKRDEGRYPYLTDEELKPVAEKFDVLFNTIEAKEGKDGNVLLFSFAGKAARGADLMALDQAQLRIASGDSAETVRQETSWHRGDDGKWRFEISDDQAKLRVPGKTAGEVIDSAVLDAISGNRKFPVTSDLIDHAQLFVAYPKLSNIKVEKMPAGGTALARLQRRATGFTIQLRESMPREKVASAILHELQHGIQVYEGFAVGGSKNTVFSDLDVSGAKAYRLLAGEVEARNTQTRQTMTPNLRRNIAPEFTQDTASSDVIVTFNGKDITNKALPNNANGATITNASLIRAFDVQFPRLTKAVRTMLARGNKGERGGVVVIDSADPLMIARAFAKKTGKPISQSVQMFSDAGVINGFFDPKSGLTFLVGPNLNPVTGTAVLLHEMIHGQQRQKIDKAALSMLMNRGKEKNAETRAFLDRVAARMDDAGETANAQEAGAYIVEQAVMEGKSAGYGTADSRFLSWVDQNIGKKVGDFLRLFIGNVRSWALRNGLPIGPITVDDLVSYAMAGMKQAGRGNVDGGVRYSKNATEDRLEGRRQFEETEKAYGGRASYDQAKSEGKTKLNYQQWVQVRTPAFKDWFGDWEDGRQENTAVGYVRGVRARPERNEVAETAKNTGRSEDMAGGRSVLHGAIGRNTGRIPRALIDGDTGEPRVFYHGTSEDIAAFELDHSTRKDAGWLGRGVYVASNPEMARMYANTKWGSADPNIMPLFVRSTGELYVATIEQKQRGSQLPQGEIDKATQRLIKQGYDGAYIDFTDSTELVTYYANNVKSASGNVGTFSAATDDIRFSRSGFKGIASKATYELNKTFNAPGKLSKWHTTVGTMNNLAQRSPHFKPVFEAAQGFIDDVAYYAADAAELAGKLLPKLETWKDIAKKPISASDNAAIEKPINEGTLVWTRDASGKPVRVENLATSSANMSTEEKARELMDRGMLDAGMNSAWKGQGEDKYAKLIDSRYESKMLKAGIVWTPAELKSMFGLTDDQVGLYQEFRAAVDRSLDTMGRADMLRFGGEDLKPLRQIVMDEPDIQSAARLLVERLGEMASENPDRETQLMQTAHGIVERATKVAELQADGYAPLSRFGKYTLDVVENGERQYFGLFETAREANAMAEKMRAEFGADSVTQGTLSDESYKLFAGITPESLELFGNMLGLDSDGDKAQDQAFQEYLRLTKTNRSAMRRLIHRKGIAGFSSDVGRVLASFVYSNARQTSAGLNMGDLGDAISKIPKQQGELMDVAVRLAEYIKNPQEEAQAVRGLLFAQYLGGSVASAFVNITQPFAVTFPWLSQYGGAKKAAAELARAAKDMSTKGKKYEADLAAALKAAEDDGTVSPQEVHQLMAQSRGSGSLATGDGTKLGEARAAAGNSVARLSLAWGKLFGAAEQVNRRVTFIAAYRIARDQNMENPAEFAREAVQETQFIYSKANKMQWGRGAVGGTLMTFKTYSIAYIELMHRLWNQGEKGSPERKEGRKAAMLMIATLMLMGGAGGLPFAEDAEDLIDGAAQLMGYNFSARKAKEQFLIDVFGDALAEFVDKGVSGLPGSPMDVSGRLGLGNLIPGTGLFTERTSHSRDLLEIAGPAGDLASRALSGTKKILGGDIGAGVTDFMPTAVRNAMKGVDMAATGMYRDTKGYKVLDTNMLEAALKGVGFQPKGVSKVQEANWLNQREKNFYSMKAQEIRAQWAAGIFEKDAGKVQAARDAVNEWNRKNPDQRIVIRIPDVMRRVREMAKSKDQRIADTAPKAMRARMREESARMREELN